MSYVDYKAKIGYLAEATFGVRNPDPFIAGTQIYSHGAMIKSVNFPHYTTAMNKRRPFSQFVPTTLEKGKKKVTYPLKYVLIEGHPLKYFFNNPSSVTGPDGDGLYTHTCQISDPATRRAAYSKTVHLQTDGLAAEKCFDITGCSLDAGKLSWNVLDERGIIVDEMLTGQRIVGDQAGTDPAIELTNAPAYHDANVTDHSFYKFVSATAHGQTLTTYLQSMDIDFLLDYAINYTKYSGVATDQHGLSLEKLMTGRLLKSIDFSVMLTLLEAAVPFTVIDKLLDDEMDSDLTLSFNRTVNAKTETLVITCDGSYAPPTQLDGVMPIDSLEELDPVIGIRFEPRTLTIAVKDANSVVY